ncbi:hypothetical protein GCM10009817_28020 [Terrabacter lapilli]|uniref:Fumarase D n=1 Tax=Terrabacter lapilli TaxID=436231 RepID=A0ABN2SE33_9MICO
MAGRSAPHSSYDLVCRAVGVLMEHGGADFDGAFDELLELTIRRGELLEVTAGLVVTLAEIVGTLGIDE